MASVEKPVIQITPKMKKIYSSAMFGSLFVLNFVNQKKDDTIEKEKRKLEKIIQNETIQTRDNKMIKLYNKYFEKWGKTYPIKFQIKTIFNGGKFPQVSVLVDSMFMAELKNQILTSGHNVDEIKGKLVFDVTEGGERYIKINGKEQVLKKDDIILKDEEGILASLLYGPAKRTTINLKTKNVLFLAWSPSEISEKVISDHLNQILLNFSHLYSSSSAVIQIYY